MILSLISSLVFMAQSAIVKTTPVSLADALLQNKVSYTAKGYEDSPHYLQPIKLIIKNNSVENLQIRIDPGLIFDPEQTVSQQMVTTRKELLALAPGKSDTILLYAMCTQPSKRGQKDSTRYVLRTEVSDALKQLAVFIDEKKLQGIEGQYAVWTVAAHYGMEDIVGYDSAAVSLLLPLVSKLTGKPIPPPPAANDYKRNYQTGYSFMKASIKGKFYFQYAEVKNVSIGLFRTDGVIVRELFNNPQTQPVYQEVEYAFDSDVYTEDAYVVRMVVDGRVVRERKIAMRKNYDELPNR